MSLEMFTRYAPQEWQKLHQEGQPIPQVHELARLVSLNDRLSQADVSTISISAGPEPSLSSIPPAFCHWDFRECGGRQEYDGPGLA